MGSFTTETERPDRSKDVPLMNSIEATRGVWVRKTNSGDVELWHDGEFVASWGTWNDNVAVAMLEHLYDYAFMQGQNDNQNKLRTALGLELRP